MGENTHAIIINVFIVVLFILTLITFIHTSGFHLTDDMQNKKLLQVVTIEGLETMPETDIIHNKNTAFCESQRGSSDVLNETCGNLTKRNCTTTSCCVFTSENKCVAGGVGGPTFNSDTKGKTMNLDYYYYQEKCYGSKCPN